MAGPGFTALFGGGNIYQANPSFLSLNPLTASIQLSWPIEQSFATPNVAEIIEVSASVDGLTIQLDDATQTTSGYTTLFNNVGAHTFTVLDAGGNTIASIASGTVWQLYLADNTTVNGVFRVFQFGAGASSANAAALAGAGLVAIGTTLNEQMAVHEFSADYVVLPADRATFQVWTGGSGNLALPDATAVGTNWFVAAKDAGSGNLTVTAPGGQTIDGSTQVIMPPDSSTFFITDGTQWFTLGFGQTVNSVFDFIQISVTPPGTGDFVLSGNQLNRISYRFIGALTGNINIIVPNTIQQYWVDNETTGPFTLTVKTAGGTGVVVQQGNREILYCDSANVVLANTAGAITFANGTAAGPSITFTNDATTGLYFSAPNQLNISTKGIQRVWVDANGSVTVNSPDTNTLPALTVTPALAGSAVGILVNSPLGQSAVSPGLRLTSSAGGGFAYLQLMANGATTATGMAILQNNTLDCLILNNANQNLFLGAGGLTSTVQISPTGEVKVAAPNSTAVQLATLQINAKTASAALRLQGNGSPIGAAAPAMILNSLATTGASTPAFTNNKPGANAGVTTWIPVTVDGVSGWIPVFGN